VHPWLVRDSDDAAFRTAEAELDHRRRAVVEQPRLVRGADPGARDDLGAVHRSDVVLIDTVDLFDETVGNQALLGQQLLEDGRPPLNRRRRRRVVLLAAVIVHPGHAGSR
jgi:hypothetical protein